MGDGWLHSVKYNGENVQMKQAWKYREDLQKWRPWTGPYGEVYTFEFATYIGQSLG